MKDNQHILDLKNSYNDNCHIIIERVIHINW